MFSLKTEFWVDGYTLQHFKNAVSLPLAPWFLMRNLWLFELLSPLGNKYIVFFWLLSEFVSLSSLHQLDYDVPECRFPCLLFAGFLFVDSLIFLNLWIYVSGQIWEIFSHYFFKHFFFPSTDLFLFSFQDCLQVPWFFPLLSPFCYWIHQNEFLVSSYWFFGSKISIWLICLFELLYSVHCMNTHNLFMH